MMKSKEKGRNTKKDTATTHIGASHKSASSRASSSFKHLFPGECEVRGQSHKVSC